ncbi:MAG: hypothetical protein HDR88_15375 [Bacteroides sp.]|nr:hypothetical protein [Bacteroides sp.]
MKIKFFIFLFLGAILVACQDDLPFKPVSQDNYSKTVVDYDPSMLFAE